VLDEYSKLKGNIVWRIHCDSPRKRHGSTVGRAFRSWQRPPASVTWASALIQDQTAVSASGPGPFPWPRPEGAIVGAKPSDPAAIRSIRARRIRVSGTRAARFPVTCPGWPASGRPGPRLYNSAAPAPRAKADNASQAETGDRLRHRHRSPRPGQGIISGQRIGRPVGWIGTAGDSAGEAAA